MEIKKASPSDQFAWDEYVNKHPQATAYHLFGWGLAVAASYQHTPIYLMAYQNDAVVGVLPLVEFKKPLFGKHLSSLPFCDLGAVLADSTEISSQLLQAAQQIMQQQQIKELEYRASEVSPDEGIDMTERKVRMLLNLPDSSQALWDGFKSKLRSQIRKAEKNGLTARVGHDSDLLDGFYQVFCRNMRELGSPVHSRCWFEQILKHYKNNIFIVNVYANGEVVGGGIVLYTSCCASIPWASTLSKFNRLAPNMLLYWRLLEAVADAGITTFDFGRSTFSQGTYRFKKQWGAQPELLNWQTMDNAGSWQIDQASGQSGRLRATVEKTWQRLPLPLTCWAGPKIRKYISL
ncbi:FemAB family XrtA/PEP-CTERM system-associated protein [Gayadomonas joobiniege]|uniref:FemAB family XrtA/PEP-CTERM system-associated protein n=1 Tax=Gayadomonas joobiniege TaxID=1234606 RepID=UPI00036468DC|nr:FemAB family XrtA/PEP-CTERM system-associated protein [Gayadomonas joobiniege]